MEIYKLFKEVDGGDVEIDSNWVLRFEFDREN